MNCHLHDEGYIMLTKILNVQVSDTRGDDSSNAAKYIKTKSYRHKANSYKKNFASQGNIEPLSCMRMHYDVVHGNAHVTFFVNTLPIPDHQHLWRLVRNTKHMRNVVGKTSERKKI